jgi:hypothetical protein
VGDGERTRGDLRIGEAIGELLRGERRLARYEFRGGLIGLDDWVPAAGWNEG